MKFKIYKNDINEVLSKIQGITGRKSNLAITENILIKTTDSGISISATDLETGFEGFYPAEVSGEGIIAVNASKFSDIIRNSPENEILIDEIEKQWVKISIKNVEYNIVGMNPEDFPDIPQLTDIDFFEVDSDYLKKMIEKTILISASSDEKRAHILGVYLEIKDFENEKKLRMISTDGKRLSKVDYVFNKDINIPEIEKIIIPKKALNEVNKFLETTGSVQVGVKDNHFIIKKDNETIIVCLLEGNFPEYEDIISVGDDHVIEIDKNLFKMMLKRMSILSSDDYKGVIFKFRENNLTISAANPNLGESKEDVDIIYNGNSIDISFNPQYFIETLNVINKEKVYINIKDEENPCIVQGEGDKNFLSVIMPMKI
ncbi:MAG: DNA polymerase III subunit beta [Desulfobacterales bacterium]|jgi:DNA polymerase III subunit beta|nr:DNA polymerase III subunit beta [Desulfobacteraceae bacterium]MBT7697795.1 DNA polymerase III subunit beta [Desulfobacterales bacterium]